MRFTPALLGHAESLLSQLLRFDAPADAVVSRFFREHRQLGHADRGFVAETVYAVLRRKRSLAARCGDLPNARQLVLAALVCGFGLNRRELDSVLRGNEGAWLSPPPELPVVNYIPCGCYLRRHPAQTGIPLPSRSIRTSSPFFTSAAMRAGAPSMVMRDPFTSTWSFASMRTS